MRSTAIELEPLSEEESEALVEKLLGQFAGVTGEEPPALPKEVLERTEGNPLFVEETIRMLVEGGVGQRRRGPDPGHAAGAHRGSHRPPVRRPRRRSSSALRS